MSGRSPKGPMLQAAKRSFSKKLPMRCNPKPVTKVTYRWTTLFVERLGQKVPVVG